MAIPGLFIEYLIVGALALIWIYPLLPEQWLSKIQPTLLPLLALGLYVVGMLIDFCAWIVTGYIKNGLRAWAEGGHKYSFKEMSKVFRGGGKFRRGSVISRQIYLTIHAPEVAKAAAMRGSRDRIARGAIINSILFTVVVLPDRRYIGVLMIVVSFLMWVYFELSSYDYEVKAERLVRAKVEADKNKASA